MIFFRLNKKRKSVTQNLVINFQQHKKFDQKISRIDCKTVKYLYSLTVTKVNSENVYYLQPFKDARFMSSLFLRFDPRLFILNPVEIPL